MTINFLRCNMMTDHEKKLESFWGPLFQAENSLFHGTTRSTLQSMVNDPGYTCLILNTLKWLLRRNPMGCGLMVRVFVLHLERSGSSNSPSKARVVYVILIIAVTWHRVNESTPETPFFYSEKKKKRETIKTSIFSLSEVETWVLQCLFVSAFWTQKTQKPRYQSRTWALWVW